MASRLAVKRAAAKSNREKSKGNTADAFAQEDAAEAETQWRQVADQLRPKASKLANLMDQAEPEVLAYKTLPKEHRTKLHSTNPLERLNGEIKRTSATSRRFTTTWPCGSRTA